MVRIRLGNGSWAVGGGKAAHTETGTVRKSNECMELVYLANCVLPSRSANTIQITKMCQAFARQGHDVTLLVPAHPSREADIEDLYDFYDVDPCFEIYKLARPRLSSVGTFLVNYRMGRVAARMNPDVVYSRSIVACYFASRAGTDCVFESHSPVRESRFGRVEDTFFRRLIEHDTFESLVVISDALREYYREEYPEVRDRIIVARDAADTVDESTDPVELRGKAGPLQVGYVGHLYEGRGMDLIGALAREQDGAEFHVIGGEPEDVAYWEDRMGDRDNIHFYGFLPPSELDQYRLAFDVQLAPYEQEIATNAGHNTVQWMSPLKIFEYMAAGRAIVASDLPAIREILTDGETALLCDPTDEREWANALSRLQDDDFRERLGTSARSTFHENYTYNSRAQRCLADLTTDHQPTEQRLRTASD